MTVWVGGVIASHRIPRRLPLPLYAPRKFPNNRTPRPIKASLIVITDNLKKKPVFVCILSAILCFGHVLHIPIDRGNGIAEASGLFLMPPAKLGNRYYLVRSGESVYENKGLINTNPVAKTSVDSGLSDEGEKQIVKAALELEAMGACKGSCWIWASITQRAYQSAEIIASINFVDRRNVQEPFYYPTENSYGRKQTNNVISKGYLNTDKST
ncbi:uncharacterized protein LOC131075441 [Cryptomeria japonica]|uniref:uncharacterized protein LOC131075441 n=1 Tax=Cryptomeria japonica TaxID=3369 RepID=UPI0027DA9062|nr:uncharacterized protein LOC131075441 [Cryptomeria japonica]